VAIICTTNVNIQKHFILLKLELTVFISFFRITGGYFATQH